MCGIFGWHVEAARALGLNVGPALLSLAHRGPDGEGVYATETSAGRNITLAHRRLAIIDIGGGAQPLASHDGRFIVTFNGEIYNYIELRSELIAAGHAFATGSDTEVVVEAYRAWGENCVHRFRGMFALALYDTASEVLFLARDQFGKKPLFLADIPGGVAFASEINALLTLDGVDRSINASALPELLSQRYVNGPETCFAGIRKLPPGHHLVICGTRAELTKYFIPPFLRPGPPIRGYDAALRGFGKTLEDAVRLRMRSDAAFGAFLSGGLDSSVVVALMTRHTTTRVRTFAVGFEGYARSEAHFARHVAGELHSDHSDIFVTPEDFLNAWPEALLRRGAPISEPSDIPIMLLSKHAHASVKMVLTGEGADELLCGYPKYRAERYIGLYQSIVSPTFHSAAIDPLVQRLHGTKRLKILSRALSEEDVQTRRAAWFSNATPKILQALMPGRQLRGDGLADLDFSPARQLQIHDQLTWLPDNLLERGDRMMMAASIEGRMPFMDVELAEFVARLPQRWLIRGQGKWILRQFARNLIGDAARVRKKIGFEVPLDTWLRHELHDFMIDTLLSSGSQLRDHVDVAIVRQIVDDHVADRQQNDKLLWSLINMEMFLSIFGQPPSH